VDTYFDDIGKITKVVVYYVHEDGRQVTKVYHEGSLLTARTSWSNYARDGSWRKNRIVAYDHDGATHDLPRSAIRIEENITHSDGTMNLNIS
jgi:23S rRNA U2552 (ribose-2'-O)-methylase RlmE/FtsJ